MGTRLTAIVDNVAEGDWTGEWGLSHGSAWTAYETVIARPIPLVKGKCPEGTKGIGRPNGPTWQSVTPVPWPPC